MCSQQRNASTCVYTPLRAVNLQMSLSSYTS